MFLVGRGLVRNTASVFTRILYRSLGKCEITDRPIKPSAELQLPAPDFKGTAVVGYDFKEIQLRDFRGKYLVLFFYPLNFCKLTSPNRITAFSDRIQEFKDISSEVVGVSVDSQFSHLTWVKMERANGGLGQLKFPLLSDLKREISQAYGVYNKEEGASFRSTFIIDTKGILRQYSMSDIPIDRTAENCIKLIKTYQQHDEDSKLRDRSYHSKYPDPDYPPHDTLVTLPTDDVGVFGSINCAPRGRRPRNSSYRK